MIEPFYQTCFACGKQYQHGPHKYEGKLLRGYRVGVCRMCFAGNEDGWVPHYEDKVISHLESKGIPIPERNAKGLLPIEF